MGHIPPASFEPIRDLVGQVFSYRDLQQVLSRCPGQDTLSNVASEDWPPGRVAEETLRHVENTGITRQFLSKLLEARPYREDLRATLVAAMPDLAEARSTRASVDLVISSLDQTRLAMGDPATRRAVAASREALQGFNAKVGVLAAYKDLHDSLHQIQVRRFSDLRAATARLTDPDQADKLVAYADLLAPAIVIARSAASRLPEGAQFRAKEESWINRLDDAGAQLGAALNALDGDAARMALKLVARVLAHEPPQLNRAIFLTAEELPTSGLIGALEVAAVNNGTQAALASAASELRGIRDTLARRVADHGSWQDADERLGDLDEVFQQAGNDVFAAFSEDWPAAKGAVKRLAAQAPGEDWAARIIAFADATDDELTRIDGNPGGDPKAGRDRLYRCYSEFRHGARMRFFRVDQLLKEHCAAIVRIGAPLQAILQELQP